jgi:predicted phosphodiesterase
MLGLIADAHGNGYAFDLAVHLLKTHCADRFMFLGDAVGYIPSNSVMLSISKLGATIRCVRGNHEEMLLTDKFSEESEAVYRLLQIKSILSNEQLEMISEWPSSIEEDIGGCKCLFVHGSPQNPIFGYVYPDTELSEFSREFDFVFMANTHRPFIREFNGTQYVNIGSCGLPRDDGRYGSAALFDPVKRRVRIIRFDITACTDLIVNENPSIHSLVRSVFDRTGKQINGDICP